MKAKQVLDLVAQLDNAASHMLAWLRRRHDPALAHAYCDEWAYDYARIAGRYANQLIDLAERGESNAA